MLIYNVVTVLIIAIFVDFQTVRVNIYILNKDLMDYKNLFR
jgi:hypothetical protein